MAAATVVFGGCGGDGEQAVDVEFTRADGSLATFPQTVRLGSEYSDSQSVSVEGSVVAEIER